MKRLFGLLNIILCLELIAGPYMPHASLLLPKMAQAQSTTCASGFQYNATLNRCLTTQQTALAMNAAASCPADDVACFRRNAEAALQSSEQSGQVEGAVEDKGGLFVDAGKAATVAGPLLIGGYMLYEGQQNACASYSAIALVAGGAAMFIGDWMSTSEHKKRLEQIRSEWNTIVNPSAASETNEDAKKVNATEAQSQAFEMLARSEDSMSKAAKQKKMFFTVATLAFAASALLAMTEYLYPSASICSSMNINNQRPEDYKNLSNTKLARAYINRMKDAPDLASFLVLKKSFSELDQSYSSPSLEEYQRVYKMLRIADIDRDRDVFKTIKDVTLTFINNLNPISNSHAEAPVSLMTEGMKGGGMSFQEFKNMMTYPLTRAILSTLFAGWAGIMASHAGKQEEASTKRAAFLRKMRDEFRSASGAINMCSTADRSNVSKPECYCYTSEGQRNTARSNSQTCQSLWQTNSTMAGNYFGSGIDYKGCINSSKQLDQKCACKKNNSCLKAFSNNMAGFSPGTFSMLSTALQPVNQIGNGTFDSANFNTAEANNNAMRLRKAAEKLENNPKLANYKKTKDKLASKMEAQFKKAAAGLPASILPQNNSMPSNPREAMAALEKELKPEAASVNTANAPEIGGSSESKSENPFDIGMEQPEGAPTETQLAEAMNQNLDYGQTDINTGSTTNIFELLSNRYQRSGMRRLFDEEGKTKADSPATTDVSN